MADPVTVTVNGKPHTGRPGDVLLVFPAGELKTVARLVAIVGRDGGSSWTDGTGVTVVAVPVLELASAMATMHYTNLKDD